MILREKDIISIVKKFGFTTLKFRHDSENVIDFVFQDSTKKLYEIILYNELADSDKLVSHSFLSNSQISRLKNIAY